MFNSSKIYLYGIIAALLVVLIFTNPSTADFKAELKNAYDQADGQGQVLIKVLGYVGKMQVSRKSYLVFSVFKVQGKSIIGDSEASYNLGFLGNIHEIKKGELEWLTTGKYSESISINSRNLDK